MEASLLLSRSDIRDKTIEQRSEVKVSLLLEVTESIPEESLETLRQIKDCERRSRLREEELRLQREKQKVRKIPG